MCTSLPVGLENVPLPTARAVLGTIYPRFQPFLSISAFLATNPCSFTVRWLISGISIIDKLIR
jgi:hypothetical protein